MIFSGELKDKISKLYPELKWVHIGETENGIPVYHGELSLHMNRCQFLQPGKDGKKQCMIYDYRPKICRDYGDSEYIGYICNTNPRFNRNEWLKNEALLEANDAAAWGRWHEFTASLFSK
jgi:Fe-S-cluster containining protein